MTNSDQHNPIAGAQTWRALDFSHKGKGWVILSEALSRMGDPTIADGLTCENAKFLVGAAREYHGVVAKLAELRRRRPDAPVLAQIGELIDAWPALSDEAA